MPMSSERGEGKLGSLFGLAIFAAAVLAVWNVAPVYIDDFALKDKMNEIARSPRGTTPDEKVMDMLMRYVREEGGAPLVLAKGKDLIALKIRMIAESHGIPVYEDKALARSLHDAVSVDRMIPAEFYKAVAGIILFLAARGKQARAPV